MLFPNPRSLVVAGLLVVASCGGSLGSDGDSGATSTPTTDSAGATDPATGSAESTTNSVGSAADSAGPTTTTRSAPSSGCASAFPDLSGVAGPGQGYEKPRVSVSCDGDTMTVTSNGMIGYEFVSMTPNGLRAQDFTWEVTTAPRLANTTTSIDSMLGTVAFTVTGVPIYGPMEGPVPTDQAFGDPVYNNLLDTCGGHTGYNADYHYHTIIAEAACLLEETIVGYALDGFPIYSNPGQKQTSSWVRTGNPTSNAWDAYEFTEGRGTLDRCNGIRAADGTYRYYATSSFPYVIGCYSGTPSAQTGAAAAPMPPMNGSSGNQQGPSQQVPPPGGPSQQSPSRLGPPPQGLPLGAVGVSGPTLSYFCTIV